jgi:hypothetical protein
MFGMKNTLKCMLVCLAEKLCQYFCPGCCACNASTPDWVWIFWVCSLFSMCSHQVPDGFASIFHGNPQVLNVFLHMFLIAPHFYTICFAQSCPLLDYIAGPSCIRPNFRTNIFPRDHEVSDFCILWADQNGSLQK